MSKTSPSTLMMPLFGVGSSMITACALAYLGSQGETDNVSGRWQSAGSSSKQQAASKQQVQASNRDKQEASGQWQVTGSQPHPSSQRRHDCCHSHLTRSMACQCAWPCPAPEIPGSCCSHVAVSFIIVYHDSSSLPLARATLAHNHNVQAAIIEGAGKGQSVRVGEWCMDNNT